jgi:N-methylhydantoinase A
VNRTLDEADAAALARAIADAAGKGLALLDRAGIAFEARETAVELDMSYLGQTHTVVVPLPPGLVEGHVVLTRELIRAAFEAAYAAAFGRTLAGIGARILNLRVAATGRRRKFDLALMAPPEPGADAAAALASARRGSRQVWLDGGWREAALYRRLDLPRGAVVPGPAVLDQADTTILIDSDLAGEVDRFGNLVVRRKES